MLSVKNRLNARDRFIKKYRKAGKSDDWIKGWLRGWKCLDRRTGK